MHFWLIFCFFIRVNKLVFLHTYLFKHIIKTPCCFYFISYLFLGTFPGPTIFFFNCNLLFLINGNEIFNNQWNQWHFSPLIIKILLTKKKKKIIDSNEIGNEIINYLVNSIIDILYDRKRINLFSWLKSPLFYLLCRNPIKFTPYIFKLNHKFVFVKNN